MKWIVLLARNGLLGWYLRACTSCMDGYVGKYDGAKIEIKKTMLETRGHVSG